MSEGNGDGVYHPHTAYGMPERSERSSVNADDAALVGDRVELRQCADAQVFLSLADLYNGSPQKKSRGECHGSRASADTVRNRQDSVPIEIE